MAEPLTDRIGSALFQALVGAIGMLPYRRRIPAMGWAMARIVAPLAGWRRRIRENLAMARPDLTPAEVDALCRSVPDNAGRTLAEIYSGAEFVSRIREGAVLQGPGLSALTAAAAEGRAVILACAHFGNYDAMRAALAARGWPVGALYRPMNNAAFNRHYVPAMETIARPIFPRGRRGLAEMLKFMRGGGWLALGFDQYTQDGAILSFFGLPSRTVLTPAELALKHDLPLIHVAGIRQPDGLSFRVHVGAPVPHSTPQAMMQVLNDELELLVRNHMNQWFWVHRRWK